VERAGPPSAWATAGEALAPAELLRLAAHSRRLHDLPHGDGGPVILVPGLGATDASLRPLRTFLRRHGHDSHSAGLGRIHGDVRTLGRALMERTATMRHETGRKVALVGWSLGGIMSREVARQQPRDVERVITFGSPIEGGPAHTALRHRYTDEQIAQIEQLNEYRRRVPIEVPITAMWSKRDGVVSPRACIDDHSPDVENIEVTSSHLGMGVDPDVWAIVATRLVGWRQAPR
jgi:triacylglycerol esterase/lipase EstA (alpha/beta hydrolase family)